MGGAQQITALYFHFAALMKTCELNLIRRYIFYNRTDGNSIIGNLY